MRAARQLHRRQRRAAASSYRARSRALSSERLESYKGGPEGNVLRRRLYCTHSWWTVSSVPSGLRVAPGRAGSPSLVVSPLVESGGFVKTPRNDVLLRSVEDLADAKELRSAIASILADTPMDEQALRVAVWSFVGTERRAEVPPALVITRLTEFIDDANITPLSARLALTRQVILWCVEEYYGHLGGDALAMDDSRGLAGSRASA
jgi:hypothetical protein